MEPASRVVVALDANVLYAAVRLPRWSYEVLRACLRGDMSLALPELVVIEAGRYVSTGRERNALASMLRRSHYRELPMPDPERKNQNLDLVRSAKDVPIAVSLMDGEVHYFVTSDRDFTDPGATATRFRERVQVMLPAVFLREILGWSSDDLEAIRFRRWADLSPPPP